MANIPSCSSALLTTRTTLPTSAAQLPLRGYMVVVQDVRGRYTSEGEWYPFKHEIDDGYDTIEWAAALPHSNGKVGMFGGSYVGATQMLAAIGHPPHLAGICPVVTASNYHENWTYQGGAFEQWFNESWTSGLAQDTLNRAIRQRHQCPSSAANVLPLTQYPRIQHRQAAPARSSRHARALLPRLACTPRLRRLLEAVVHRRELPEHPGARAHRRRLVRHLSGRLFAQLPAASRRMPATKRPATANSCSSPSAATPAAAARSATVDFGPAAAEYDENAVTLEWYDYLFHGTSRIEFATGKPVRIFVMGENKWRDRRRMATRARQRDAATSSTPRERPTAPPAMALSTHRRLRSEHPDTFIYDPANPVPTVGGPLCCDRPSIFPPGRAIRRKSKRAPMCSSTPRRPSSGH